jgi:hypothetical protein
LEKAMTTKTKKAPTGYIIYRGHSLLDGKPIVAVAIVGESKNVKTGNLVQTYIMADNGLSPVESARNLSDVSVCGDCKHRRGMGGSCYVNLGQGARSVMDGVMRGIYPSATPAQVSRIVSGRKIRLGTYGDPMAVPVWVWQNLVSEADSHTGYTHQWQPEKRKRMDVLYPDQYDGIRALCMASVDTEDEWFSASLENWRTFRVRSADDEKANTEFVCPASEEAGKRVTCSQCMACNGVGEDDVRIKKATPVIIVHGSLKKRFESTVRQ